MLTLQSQAVILFLRVNTNKEHNMQKHEMASRIAKALFPEHYRFESPAVQGEYESLMKLKKIELEALMPGCVKVETQRAK